MAEAMATVVLGRRGADDARDADGERVVAKTRTGATAAPRILGGSTSSEKPLAVTTK